MCRSTKGWSFLAALSGLVAPTSLAAQSSREAEKPAGLDEAASKDQAIVVTGQKLEALEAFIRELTYAPNGQIARWNSEICPRAIGLSPGQNTYLSEAVATIARRIPVRVAHGSCHANVLIVVTDEADKFTRLLLKRHPHLFGAFGSGRPPAAAISSLFEPRPVRWINASEWADSDGAPITEIHPVRSMSRLEQTVREDATLSLVVVDATKLQGLTWGALSSYLAMVALARPAPSVNAGNSPTILSLFYNRDQGRRGPQSLTRWDRAFLRALYASKANVKAEAQQRAIQRNVQETLKKSDESPED